MKKVFIAWKPFCARSHNQAQHFGAEEIYIYFLSGWHSRFALALRYLLSFFSTLNRLRQERPSVIFTLNQPPFLLLAIYLYTRLYGGVYLLDSHSAAFNDYKWAWARPFYRFIAKRAFLNINTNEHHKKLVEQWGGRSIVISDVPIDHSDVYPHQPVPSNSIAVVASFMFDEPIEAIWQAARQTPEIHYYVTGNANKLDNRLRRQTPSNIHLTGFLKRDDYLGLLCSVAGVMALTTRDHTMQMGAYEALSLKQPIITSDWPILRASFGDSALYVDNSAAAIAQAAQQLIQNTVFYQKAAAAQRQQRRAYFEQVKNSILAALQRWEHKSSSSKNSQSEVK